MGRKPKPKTGPTTDVVGTSDPSSKTVENDQHMKNTPSVPATRKKAVKSKNMLVTRRSGRIKSLPSSVPNKKIIVEEIDGPDSDGQDEPHVEEVSNESEELPHDEDLSAEPDSNQHGLEEKIDFLVQSIKEFKSKANKKRFPSDTPLTEFNYRALYIESQKKIDSLLDENQQLAKKLEFALGEVKAYEQMKDLIVNLKDMMLLSNLGKATEAVMNCSNHAKAANLADACGSPPPAATAAGGSPPAAAGFAPPPATAAAVAPPPATAAVAANNCEAKDSQEKKKRRWKKK